MSRFKTAAALAVALGLGVAGCSGNGGSVGGFSGQQANVNLVVSDLFFHEVSLYLNVLQNSTEPTPDAVLDGVGSGIVTATDLILTDEDLIVCDGDIPPFGSGADTVSIFRDYRSLTDAAPANVIFTSANVPAMNNPHQCAYNKANDTLIIANFGTDEVFLVSDVANIADGTNPVATFVTLNNAASLINDAAGIAADDADLYVANSAAVGPGAACVTIYRDYPAAVSAQVPDVTLDWETSFLGDALVPVPNCIQVSLINNGDDPNDTDSLFVTSPFGVVYIFKDAASISTDQLPDVILSGTDSNLVLPLAPVAAGSTVFVPNYNFLANLIFGTGSCGDARGLVGFSPINGLSDDEAPSVTLDADVDVASSTGAAVAGGALFLLSTPNCNVTEGNVGIYQNASSLTTNQIPNMLFAGTLSGVDQFALPIALDAVENDIDSST